MLQQLQDQFGLTNLFISHDLSGVRYMCDEVALLYPGKIVEQAPVETILEDSRHPCTQALISAISEPEPDAQREQIVLRGDLTPGRAERGCPLAPRCHAEPLARCETDEPPLVLVDAAHQVACHLHPGDSPC